MYINPPTKTCEDSMGIDTLEEKYQLVLKRAGIDISRLSRYANQATLIQNEMRAIFNQLTPHLCTHCENKCCEGFPVEGWFSPEDYTLFRVKYDKPTLPPNRVNLQSACYFLTPEGCSLPEEMRPFTCVKVNCEKLNKSINATGKTQQLNQLKNALDKIHREVSSLIKSNNLLSSQHSQVNYHP